MRLDVLHLGPRRAPVYTAIEVKSCRADFLGDSKLAGYIGRVHELWVAAPAGAVWPDELPDGVGLLELNQGWTYKPSTDEDLLARLSQPFELMLPGAGVPGVGDVFWRIKAPQRFSLPSEATIDLLTGATSRVPLLAEAGAMHERKLRLEQMLWLEREKAA